MKYYIGEIRERNGDMEYNTKYLFTTNNDPDKYTDMVAMEWRGGDKGDYDEDQMGFMQYRQQEHTIQSGARQEAV